MRVKRWLALGLVMLMSILVVAYETNASDRNFFLPDPLEGVKIVVDAGHGGEDGGASKGDVVEAAITLAISQQVERQLKRRGATVVMTRTTDGDVLTEHASSERAGTLRERKKQDIYLRKDIVEKEQPNIFVTIHANAIPETKWRGAQVFFHKDGHADGEILAKNIQQSIRTNLKNTDREALSIKEVYLLKKVQIPAVLVETGFISNDEERALLIDKDYQKKMADSIVEGIENYLLSKVQ